MKISIFSDFDAARAKHSERQQMRPAEEIYADYITHDYMDYVGQSKLWGEFVKAAYAQKLWWPEKLTHEQQLALSEEDREKYERWLFGHNEPICRRRENPKPEKPEPRGFNNEIYDAEYGRPRGGMEDWEWGE